MRLKMSFEGIGVEPGDVVLIRPHGDIDADTAQQIWKECKHIFPNNDVLILRPDCELQKYNKNEFMKFWNEVKNKIEGSATE